MTHHEHDHPADAVSEQPADFQPEETAISESDMPEMNAASENKDNAADEHVTLDESGYLALETPAEAVMLAQSEPMSEPVQQEFVLNPDEVRLQELNLAIELHPEAPVNYLLRGEWFLAKKQLYIAQEDFQKAFTLAETQLDTSDWGIVEQWVIDKALAYLENINQML